MNPKKWGCLALAAVLLVTYNMTQPGLLAMRSNDTFYEKTHKREGYGPSMVWVDRLMNGQRGSAKFAETKLNFNVLSSMMIAGLASGFRSQVANLLWMKSDEYWHEGLTTRQIPLMEAVVELDPEFIDAWSTAGWHWAYNIYADEPDHPELKKDPVKLRRKQLYDITVGVDYLDRGSAMNPDTYRLWFEDGWTRAKKGGNLDDDAIRMFQEARSKDDARLLEKTVQENKKQVTEKVRGSDLIGRTVGHMYEQRPEVDKALNQYSIMLYNGKYEKATGKASDTRWTKPLPATEEALLRDCGKYWGLYGTDYSRIVSIYTDGDSVVKGQIKHLIPDIDHMVDCQAERIKAQNYDDQPTGAYLTITARYLPAWNLYKAGKLDQAVDTIIGVMNADPKYHLKKLNVTGQVFALAGDSPVVIARELKEARDGEKSSAQEIGLHFLAKLYEAEAKAAKDSATKTKYLHLAYETWYRSRLRNSLDYYGLVNTFPFEDDYGFKPPKDIIKDVKNSRKAGDVDAAPEAPPNVSQYQPDA